MTRTANIYINIDRLQRIFETVNFYDFVSDDGEDEISPHDIVGVIIEAYVFEGGDPERMTSVAVKTLNREFDIDSRTAHDLVRDATKNNTTMYHLRSQLRRFTRLAERLRNIEFTWYDYNVKMTITYD